MNPDMQLSFGLCLVFILLEPFAIAGLALINTGLGRSRSAAQAITTALCVVSTAALVYFVCGFAAAGSPLFIWFGGNGRSVLEPAMFFFRGAGVLTLVVAIFGVFSVGLSSLIPLGASADRLRLGAACASAGVFAALTYPVFSFFSWHSRAGLFGTVGFLDSGGSGFINVVGGLTALAIAWILGARQGKYPPKGMPAAIPAHNQVYVL